jgi:hypothetical protein
LLKDSLTRLKNREIWLNSGNYSANSLVAPDPLEVISPGAARLTLCAAPIK